MKIKLDKAASPDISIVHGNKKSFHQAKKRMQNQRSMAASANQKRFEGK